MKQHICPFLLFKSELKVWVIFDCLLQFVSVIKISDEKKIHAI
jgi:hypothetical protein